jgi:hypothetical protein
MFTPYKITQNSASSAWAGQTENNINNQKVEKVKKVKGEGLKYFISYTSSTCSTLW